jgi:uncharacterized protein (DUF433 family)
MNPGETKKFEVRGRKCRVRYTWNRALRRHRFSGYVGRLQVDELGLGFRTEEEARQAIEVCVRNLDYQDSPEFLAELERRGQEMDEGKLYTSEEVLERLRRRTKRFKKILAEVLVRHPRIVSDAKICQGHIAVGGTRVPVSIVVGSVKGGMSPADIQREYDLTPEDVQAALKFRKDLEEAYAEKDRED